MIRRIILIIIAAFIVLSSIYKVDEIDQAIVLAFGKPVGTVTKPGLQPVLWIELLPRWRASSTRALIAGSMRPGWWNSPRVVTMFAPDSSILQISS